MQTSEQLHDIKISNQLKDIQGTEAWLQVEQLIKDRLEQLKLQRDGSCDPSVIMSCIRMEDGILFIKEAISDLIKRGQDALMYGSD